MTIRGFLGAIHKLLFSSFKVGNAFKTILHIPLVFQSYSVIKKNSCYHTITEVLFWV